MCGITFKITRVDRYLEVAVPVLVQSRLESRRSLYFKIHVDLGKTTGGSAAIADD